MLDAIGPHPYRWGAIQRLGREGRREHFCLAFRDGLLVLFGADGFQLLDSFRAEMVQDAFRHHAVRIENLRLFQGKPGIPQAAQLLFDFLFRRNAAFCSFQDEIGHRRHMVALVIAGRQRQRFPGLRGEIERERNLPHQVFQGEGFLFRLHIPIDLALLLGPRFVIHTEAPLLHRKYGSCRHIGDGLLGGLIGNTGDF